MHVCCWEHIVTCLDSITQRHPRGAMASYIALNLGGSRVRFWVRNSGTRPLPSSRSFCHLTPPNKSC